MDSKFKVMQFAENEQIHMLPRDCMYLYSQLETSLYQLGNYFLTKETLTDFLP